MRKTFAQKNFAKIEGDQIFVFSRYSEAFVQDCRQIEGRRWDNASKANVFPLSSAPLVKALATKWSISLPISMRGIEPEEYFYTNSQYFENISLFNDEIVICFDYDPVLISSIRSFIPDVKWDPSTKTWRTRPKNIEGAAKFAEKFDLTVAPSIKEHIDEIINEAKAMRSASSAIEGEIEVPGIAQDLLPYQKAGVLYLKKVRKGILADQPGLGKTVQALATVASENRFPAVVVCPNTLKLNWQREVAKFFPHLKVSILSGTKSLAPEKSDVLIINYDILYERVDDIIDHGYQSLIVDEAHAIKNGEKRHVCPKCESPVRSNAIKCNACSSSIKPAEKWTVKRTAAVMRLTKTLGDEDFVLLLTGTPITNRPHELVPQLEAIGRLDKFGGAWRFKNRYAPKRNVATNTMELNEKLREMCFVRRVKKDVYGELPPLRNAIQYLSPNDKEMAEYRETEKDVIEYFADRAKRIAEESGSDGTEAYWQKRIRLEPAESLVRITGLREKVSSIKFRSVVEWIDNFLETSEGEKVIIFAEHISFIEQLHKRYKSVAVKVRGSVSIEDRQKAVDSFQNDPNCRIFIGNMQAASEGLTLTAASDVIFCELGWTPAIHEQCVSRCYGRANDLHGATAWYLITPSTIEETIYGLLERKKKIIDSVTDGIDMAEESSIMGDLVVDLAERGMK
jgi:SNF2 family DNA or RNA helicase